MAMAISRGGGRIEPCRVVQRSVDDVAPVRTHLTGFLKVCNTRRSGENLRSRDPLRCSDPSKSRRSRTFFPIKLFLKGSQVKSQSP